MSIRIIDIRPGEPVPEQVNEGEAYRFLPHFDEAFYRERTDRNIGWITREEQEMLRHKVVGIAGCGGMGGLLASIFVRLGVGEVRIADCEVFDVSNINRQFAAMRDTVGKSKALETAREVRRICDDTTLVVYPQGICEETVHSFLDGCDVVCDEIEFWAVYPRLLLHRDARSLGIPIFVCDTVGFGTRLFLFTKDSPRIETMLQCDMDEARELHTKIHRHTILSHEIDALLARLMAGFVPEIPTYTSDGSDRASIWERLASKRRASIISTNPPLAAGFLSDRVLLYLLGIAGLKRCDAHATPPMPLYLYFDAAKMDAHERLHPLFS